MDVKLHDNSALRSWFFFKKRKSEEPAQETEKERLVRWEGLLLEST